MASDGSRPARDSALRSTVADTICELRTKSSAIDLPLSLRPIPSEDVSMAVRLGNRLVLFIP